MRPVGRAAARIVPAALGGLLFGLAYGLPAIGTCSRDPARSITWFDNATVLFFGWLGIFAFQIGWFANLAFACNLVAVLRGVASPHWRLVVHGALLLVGLLTLQPALGMELPHNEAWSEPICRLGTGVWLWVAAHLVILAGAARKTW